MQILTMKKLKTERAGCSSDDKVESDGNLGSREAGGERHVYGEEIRNRNSLRLRLNEKLSPGTLVADRLGVQVHWSRI